MARLTKSQRIAVDALRRHCSFRAAANLAGMSDGVIRRAIRAANRHLEDGGRPDAPAVRFGMRCKKAMGEAEAEISAVAASATSPRYALAHLDRLSSVGWALGDDAEVVTDQWSAYATEQSEGAGDD